jgi:hypothetical protein
MRCVTLQQQQQQQQQLCAHSVLTAEDRRWLLVALLCDRSSENNILGVIQSIRLS